MIAVLAARSAELAGPHRAKCRQRASMRAAKIVRFLGEEMAGLVVDAQEDGLMVRRKPHASADLPLLLGSNAGFTT
jgi:hypothetical protein